MRYIVLVLLNLPIILLALVNIITQYKMRRVSKARFRHQIILWVVILVVLISSFPVYNAINNRPPLDSAELSAFDIVEIVSIVFLIYVVNNQRQQLERTERLVRDLHQEISIRLSTGRSSVVSEDKFEEK